MASALRWLTAVLVTAAVFGAVDPAWAIIGQPAPWEIGLQQAATPVMTDIIWFHNLLLWIITGIVILVLALLVTVIIRFSAKKNPVPTRTTHNTMVELVWTIVPVIILVFIAVPSFRLMFFELNTPPADLTIKATGKQWYWTYSYPDSGNFEFDSLMVADKDLKPGQPRLLAVDNEMVVPVNKVIRVQTIGADVIHSFAVPSFGIKIDAIPGRLNETWFKAPKEGVYYGQCSELCGRDHAFMPIAVRVVSEKAFADWIAQAKQKWASDDAKPLTVAATAPRPGK
jgi:cytochrome c oxidase subunit 2